MKQSLTRSDSALARHAPPQSSHELKRLSRMFAYYSKWIENFSARAGPFFRAVSFPLDSQGLESFARLKDDLAKASLGTIRDDLAFEVESDASDYAIATILSQGGRPVAFMSRSLNKCERNYPAVEKEAMAIIEAVRK